MPRPKCMTNQHYTLPDCPLPSSPFRNVKKRQDISDLAQYLGKVDSVRDWAEGLLWGHIRDYHDMAKSNPRLLVDCLQVVQLQEQVDRQYLAAKLHYIKPKRYKDRWDRAGGWPVALRPAWQQLCTAHLSHVWTACHASAAMLVLPCC
jgi:hypothetical protein